MPWELSKLAALAARIRNFGTAPNRAAARAASVVQGLIRQEFIEGTDPYDRPWAPLAPSTVAAGRFHPPLTDTGEMRDSVSVQAVGRDLVGHIDHPARPHQTGWVGPKSSGPARPIVPSGDMPPRWGEAIRASVAEELRRP